MSNPKTPMFAASIPQLDAIQANLFPRYSAQAGTETELPEDFRQSSREQGIQSATMGICQSPRSRD